MQILSLSQHAHFAQNNADAMVGFYFKPPLSGQGAHDPIEVWGHVRSNTYAVLPFQLLHSNLFIIC